MRKVLLLAAVAMPLAAGAEEVRIGLGAAVTSMDPHFHALTPNVAVHQHLFGALVGLDARLGLKPELALSWRPVDDTTWEFVLRRDVRFHDGSPFTAEDVVFSAARVAEVPNSPGRFTIYTRHITGFEIVDPHTLRVKTARVYPLMPNQLAGLLIVSKAVSERASTADFNAGRAAIGTGPYRFARYEPGNLIVIERNDAYYGDPEPWSRVTFRLMTNAAARVAALRAGDVDMIDAVPTEDANALARDPALAVFSTPGVRNIYLYLDQKRDVTPGVTDAQGRPLDRNPLKDVRVRRALSLAINREGIVRQVMGGHATPSGQLLPAGVMGHDPTLKPDPFDPQQARALLAEAGYPNGFSIVLAGPNDRYVNDDRVVQAIAQMWTRIGVRTQVNTLPSAVFFPRSARDEFSVGLLGWGTGTGEPDSPLQALIATPDRDRGWGQFNRSGYSNPQVDALLEQALSTLDRGAREQLYFRAIRIAMEDKAIIPLHHQVNIWATRRGLVYNARNDERTMATELRRAP